MKEEIKNGKLLYFSFVLLDIICLILSNIFAAWIYLGQNAEAEYGIGNYISLATNSSPSGRTKVTPV